MVPSGSTDQPAVSVVPGEPVRICFVCLGNICRSPTAEAVMARLVEDRGLGHHLEVDSAGTGNWHIGDPPDERATAEAARRGVAMRSRARQFAPEDFDRFHLVVAMDRFNAADLVELADQTETAGAAIDEPGARRGVDRRMRPRHKVTLLRAFDPDLVGTIGSPPPCIEPGGAGRIDERWDVPDPYFGGADGFSLAFDLIEAACRGLLAHLRPVITGSEDPGGAAGTGTDPGGRPHP